MEPVSSARPVDDLEHRFAFHPATSRQRQEDHAEVRAECLELARVFQTLLPNGREKSTAITKLEEAMMWANAAIARSPE